MDLYNYNFYEKKYELFYNDLLNNFTSYLNNYHKTKYSEDEWQILIAPWLHSMLQLYFINLKKNSHKKKKNSQFISIDFESFNSHLADEKFHSEFNEIKNNNKKKVYYFPIKKIELHKKLYYFYKVIFFIFSIKILHSKSRFSFFNKVKIFIDTFFSCIHLPDCNRIFKIKFKKKKLQRNINISFIDVSIFKQKNLFITFLKFIPTSYLENFKTLKNSGDSLFKKVHYFFSDSTYISDEFLKIQMMNFKKKYNTKIFLEQHGGNQKLLKSIYNNYYEKKIGSKYLIWGTKKIGPKEIYLPSLRIMRNKNKFNIKNDNFKYDYCNILQPIKKDKILYLYRYHYDVKKFYKKLTSLIKKNKLSYVYKIYPETRYQSQLNTMQISKLFKIQNEHIFDNFDIINQSKVLIMNYLSTMLFECIAYNKPFILYMPEQFKNLSSTGVSFLNELSKINLFFNSEKKFINFIKSPMNVENNWLKINTIKELNNIKNKYIKIDNDPKKNYLLWKNFFNKVVLK